MRRNNHFVAILAICTILPILRNSSAREQLPSNYDHDKLRTNVGKAAYEAYETYEPSLLTSNVRNNEESDRKFQYEPSELTTYGSTNSRSWDFSKSTNPSVPIQRDEDRSETTKAISTTVSSWKKSNFKDANLLDEKYFGKRSSKVYENSSSLSHEESKIVNSLSKRDSRERSNNFHAAKQRRRAMKRSPTESFDAPRESTAWSIEIPREKRLSSWISQGAIKNFSRRRNDVIHRTKTEAYKGERPRSRKSETSSVKKANHWGEEQESSAFDDTEVTDVTLRRGGFTDTKQPYKRVDRTLTGDDLLTGYRKIDEKTKKEIESQTDNNLSANHLHSDCDTQKFDQTNDESVDNFGKGKHVGLEFMMKLRKNLGEVKEGRASRLNSVVNKLTEHETTDFEFQESVLPVPPGSWLNIDGTVSDKSTFNKKIEKGTNTVKNDFATEAEKRKDTSTITLQPRRSKFELTTDRTNKFSNRKKSVYNLIKNTNHIVGKYHFENSERRMKNSARRLNKNLNDSNQVSNDNIKITNKFKDTQRSKVSESSSILKSFDETTREKRHAVNLDDHFFQIMNLGHVSPSHKSAKIQLTEGTYENSGTRSKERSKVNIGEEKDNSLPSVVSPYFHGDRATFSTSSATISIHSILDEVDSTEYPPRAREKGNSVVSHDTSTSLPNTVMPGYVHDSTKKDRGIKHSEHVNLTAAPIDVAEVILKKSILNTQNNGKNKSDTLITLNNVTSSVLTGEMLLANEMNNEPNEKLNLNPLIKKDSNYSKSNVVNIDAFAVSGNVNNKEEIRSGDDIKVSTETVTKETSISSGITEQSINASSDFPRISIMEERNATYLKRGMNIQVMETRRRFSALRDSRPLSPIGARNVPDPFRNSGVRSLSKGKEQKLAKNSEIGKIRTSDSMIGQLYASRNVNTTKFKINEDLTFSKTNVRKPEEKRIVDKIIPLKDEAKELDIADQKISLINEDGESTSLMVPSKVFQERRDQAAENYEEKNAIVKSNEQLSDMSTNVSLIAFKSSSVISSSASGDLHDQNKAHQRMNFDETKDNESTVDFTLGIGKTKGVEDSQEEERYGGISNNGTADEVNSREEKNGSMKDPVYRQLSNPLQLSTTPASNLSNEYLSLQKRRKSRSSKKKEPAITNDTTTGYRSSELPQTFNVARETAVTTMRYSDSTYNDGSSITSPKIDSQLEIPENHNLGTPTIMLERTLHHPLEFTRFSDQSTVTSEITETESTTREPLTNKNTLSSSTVRTIDMKPSIGTFSPDEDYVFGYETNSWTDTFAQDYTEELREMVENVSPRNMDNSSHDVELFNQWPVKHSAVVEGDLVLGGLMMVHEREDSITCGPVMPQGGVQALEAMLYTLDTLNDREIVPGVKIGAHILDDCDKDTYGLEMAVDFIKGSISNIDGAEYHCNKTAVRKVISGVVGAASSVTSIQVANLLRLFRIPQVSFFSTSPELSNKQRFEYFTRTIPSDHYQVKAMVDIVLSMGWRYVSIIYEESNYGIKAFEELEELLGKHDICIAIKEKLVKDSGVAEETAYDNIVLKLLTKPRARGCIIFGSDQEVAGVMRAVRRCNATGAFSWIGSDGWSARGLVSNGNEPEVEGTLSVQPQANPVKGFEEYFLNLTVENNRRNPWFVEFWEDHFQCRYPNASRTPYNQKYTVPCTSKERLTKQNTVFEDQLQFVSDAVMAFAYAFRDMHNDLCHGKSGLCDAMKPTKGTELLKYLRKVEFEGLSGDRFRFDKNGDGPARYNIIHFKQTEPGKYKWVRVGKYLEGELRLNTSEIQFKLGHPQPPESVCSLPCEVGQAKKYVEGERCCWHCFNCTQYQIRHPKDETQCIPCQQGTVPNETHSACRDIPEEFLRPESGWAIGAMSFSATGMMITLFVCGVFLKHNDTPVVRASGRELSYVLLSGILLCYLVTFALVLRPTNIVCGIQRFTAGFCFTVVYAALLTKTNRISRIFNAGKHSAKRPSFISPRSQLIICSGLIFIQILINGVWMIIDPARAMHHYPTREDNLLVCNSYIDASYMIAFAYPIMLIVVCTVYAVLTRKIPEAFNESKHIGFTMYTTCVIWLAFVPLYFGTGSNVALRITSMSVTISLSASVTIACLFSPKLYIILIRPERNVRQSMMPTRYSTTKSSAVTGTNASSMMAPITLTAATCDQNKTVKKHIITTIDCSTQSEYYELEVKDKKNGESSPAVVSQSTQTCNSENESNTLTMSNKDTKETTATTKQLNNNARIGNGPLNQSDVSL